MVLTFTPSAELGSPLVNFELPQVTGGLFSTKSLPMGKPVLIIFMCNHCPYVKAVIDRIVRDTQELAGHGIGSVAVMSNDVAVYPEDSLENMQRWAAELNFPFPYLFDESQAIARAYGAVCTPDYFGYNHALQLQYRGRLDGSGRQPAAPDARRELFEAMSAVAQTGRGPALQSPSIGCSIKWKAD